jgi:cob(I)alamin adenosyltransferase
MVTLNRIYTRTGDGGQTALGSGQRVAKDADRIAAYGTVDEANAALGLARLHTEGALDAALARIQNDLFDLGADLCVPEDPAAPPGSRARLRVSDAQVQRLEQEIDAMNAALAPLTSFLLPGGTQAAAHLHLARTIVRRAERAMVTLARSEPVSEPALRYVNRLSDHLFVAARAANATAGRPDILWVPGANR